MRAANIRAQQRRGVAAPVASGGPRPLTDAGRRDAARALLLSAYRWPGGLAEVLAAATELVERSSSLLRTAELAARPERRVSGG